MLRSNSIASNCSNLSSRSPLSIAETEAGANDTPRDQVEDDEFISFTDTLASAISVPQPEQIDPKWICQTFTPKSDLRPELNAMFEHLAKMNEQSKTRGSIFYLFHSNQLGYIKLNTAFEQLEKNKPVSLKLSITNEFGKINTIPQHTRVFFSLPEMHEWYCED